MAHVGLDTLATVSGKNGGRRQLQEQNKPKKPRRGGGGGGGNPAPAPPPYQPPPIPTGTPPVPPPNPPDTPGTVNPVFNYNGLLNTAHTFSSNALANMPLSGPFEAGRRNLEDSLSGGLNSIQNQWSLIAPSNNLFLQRLATNQGKDTSDLQEQMVGRGIYDSSITPYEVGQLNQGYDRQRQDQAFTLAGQYGDLSNQAGSQLQDYERGLIDLLLQEAADQAANPTDQVSHKHGDTTDYSSGGGANGGGDNNNGGGGGNNNGGGNHKKKKN